MCTVVFIPGKEEKYFASLRDESPERPLALAPELFLENEIHYMATKDPLAGGTWIGVNEFQNVIILLNGSFNNHKRENDYVKSRGLIVKELLQTEMPVIEWNLMDLNKVEPFTLVVFSDHNLFELVWDGLKKHRKILNQNIPHIWSSSTLYDYQAKAHRKASFDNWQAMDPPVTKLSLLNFFKSIQDSENGFIINRSEKLKTLSYSFVSLNSNGFAEFNYFDLKSYTHHAKSINFIPKSFDWPLAIN